MALPDLCRGKDCEGVSVSGMKDAVDELQSRIADLALEQLPEDQEVLSNTAGAAFSQVERCHTWHPFCNSKPASSGEEPKLTCADCTEGRLLG